MTKTVTLQTAIRLKEAGWEKETEYGHYLMIDGSWKLFHNCDVIITGANRPLWDQVYRDKVFAPGLELLEELPKEIVKDGDEYILTIVMVNTGCEISYNHQYLGETIRLHPVSGENIFEALAELVMLKLTNKL